MMASSGEHQQRVPGGDWTKVTFVLEASDWHDHATETLWAEPVAGDRFRLRNVPFYAYGVSYDDTVIAPQTDEGRLVQKVSDRGGHSTYRIFVSNTDTLKRFSRHWAPLEALGCTLERATERLFAVDIPPEADINRVYEALAVGEAAEVWDFEEAYVSHLLKAQQ